MNQSIREPLRADTPVFLVRLLGFGVLIALAYRVSSVIRYPDLGFAVLFPPYAVLTAALVLTPRRDWIWYVAIAWTGHFAADWPGWPASWIVIAEIANTARALVAAELLRRLFPRPLALDTVPALASFVIITSVLAPMIGATAGATTVLLHLGLDSYWDTWRPWFMSNALTGLTILPALLLVSPQISHWREARMPPVPRLLEILGVVAALAITSAVAFLVPGTTRWQLALNLYTPLPVLIWAAMRFGATGASLALASVTVAAIWSADSGRGPWGSRPTDQNVMVLQIFVVLSAVPVMCIAVVSSARQAMLDLHRSLVASLHHSVCIVDARGMMLEANDAWKANAERYGWAKIGDNTIDVCARWFTDPDYHDLASRFLQGMITVLHHQQRHFVLEFDWDRDTAPRRFEVCIDALIRPEGGAVVTQSDVTERHQAHIQLEQQRVELSHLARVASLGQLSGALAHELNQPLTSIGANAEAGLHLLARRKPDMAELDAILRDILTEDQRAAQVIRRLRALLKRGKTRLVQIYVEDLIGAVLGLARPELITQRVTATTSIPPNLPPISGDRVQLQQVLLNLILNACDAMRGIPAPERRLTVDVDLDGTDIRMAFRDAGTGIRLDLLPRLFEPFVSSKSEGLGLGLSISRTIVAAHGGHLWAENNATRGATLFCELPVVEPALRILRPEKPTTDSIPTTAGMA